MTKNGIQWVSDTPNIISVDSNRTSYSIKSAVPGIVKVISTYNNTIIDTLSFEVIKQSVISPEFNSCPNTDSCVLVTCSRCGLEYCQTHHPHTCTSDIEITPDIIYARSRVENDEWSAWYPLEKTVSEEYRNNLSSKFIQFSEVLKKFTAVGAVH
jgi:hypothetical protein